MPVYLNITIRSIMTYLTLFVLARAMGKREIAQITFFDYIVGISIGSIAAQVSTNLNSTWVQMLPALIVFAVFQIANAILSQKSIKFRNIVDGSPTILIKQGEILDRNLSKEKLTSNELIGLLREKNIFKIADVETAILEVDGKISVQLKTDKQPVTAIELNIPVQPEGLPRLVIADGNILGESLKDLNLTRSWLLAKLGEQNVKDTSKVMLAQVDTAGNLYVDLFDDKNNK